MNELVPKKYKRVYSALLRLRFHDYIVGSESFEHTLLEIDWDDDWRAALRRTESALSFMVDDREHAENAMIELVATKHHALSEKDFLLGFSTLLADYEPWVLHKFEARASFVSLMTALVEDLGIEMKSLADWFMPNVSRASVTVHDPVAPSEESSMSDEDRQSMESEEDPTPALFIGSSVEGKAVADAIQVDLDHDAYCTVWSQGVFGLSGETLGALVDATRKFDYAALVLTPDDVTTKTKRNEGPKSSARDNVIFELGLFIGALGRERTFIIAPRDVDLTLPTDLAGVTRADYRSKRPDENLQAAIGSACTKMRRRMQKLGRLKR